MKLTLLRQNIVRGSVISVLLAVKIASGRDLPPIHFGRADGVERTLLRIACQSETFLASPWHGDASIRFLWHIGCQSDFDKLRKCLPVRQKGGCPDGRRLPGYFTDCFLYLWRHRQGGGRQECKGYLYFAVRNRCLSCLRSRKSLQKTKDEIEQLMSL